MSNKDFNKLRKLTELKRFSELESLIGSDKAIIFKQHRSSIAMITDNNIERLLRGVKVTECPKCESFNYFELVPADSRYKKEKQKSIYYCDYCKHVEAVYPISISEE